MAGATVCTGMASSEYRQCEEAMEATAMSAIVTELCAEVDALRQQNTALVEALNACRKALMNMAEEEEAEGRIGLAREAMKLIATVKP